MRIGNPVPQASPDEELTVNAPPGMPGQLIPWVIRYPCLGHGL